MEVFSWALGRTPVTCITSEECRRLNAELLLRSAVTLVDPPPVDPPPVLDPGLDGRLLLVLERGGRILLLLGDFLPVSSSSSSSTVPGVAGVIGVIGVDLVEIVVVQSYIVHI